MKTIRLFASVFCLLGGLLSLGCGSGSISRVKFNDVLVEQSRLLFKYARKRNPAIGQNSGSKDFSPEAIDKLKVADHQLSKALAEAKTIVDGLPLPALNSARSIWKSSRPFSGRAGALRQMYQGNCQHCRGGRVFRRQGGPGRSDLQANRGRGETLPMGALLAAQTKFAEENNFKLTMRYKDAGAK